MTNKLNAIEIGELFTQSLRDKNVTAGDVIHGAFWFLACFINCSAQVKDLEHARQLLETSKSTTLNYLASEGWE